MTAPAIILGEGINALTVARSLGRHNIPSYLLGSWKNDISARSRYVNVIEQPDQITADTVVAGIRSAAAVCDDLPIVMCASDEYLQILSAQREQLADCCRINLPSREAVETVLDKTKFGAFCVNHNLPAPKSWKPATKQELEQCLEQVELPVVIKPTFSHGNVIRRFQRNASFAKIVRIEDKDELVAQYCELKEIGADPLIQEYIVGPDREHYSYFSYRTEECRQLVGLGVRKIRVSPIHGGAGTFIEVADYAEMARASKRLLDELQYTGISSVCYKRDIRSGRFVLHEMNGRIPMGHASALLSGVNLPYIAYQDALGEPINLELKVPGKGKWVSFERDLNACRAYRKAGELSTIKWLWSLRHVRVCAEFGFDDLRPVGFLLRNLIRRAGRSLLRAIGLKQR